MYSHNQVIPESRFADRTVEAGSTFEQTNLHHPASHVIKAELLLSYYSL
jgi:hypothetical protein